MHYANIIIEGLTFFLPFFSLWIFRICTSDFNILSSGEMVGWVAAQHIEDICGTVGTPGICTLESF